jgi:hypothetical protein
MEPCPQSQENIERGFDPGIYRTMRSKESVGIRSKSEAIGSASRFGIGGELQKGNLSSTDTGENAHFPGEYRQEHQRRNRVPRSTLLSMPNRATSPWLKFAMFNSCSTFGPFQAGSVLHALLTWPTQLERCKCFLTRIGPISDLLPVYEQPTIYTSSGFGPTQFAALAREHERDSAALVPA